MLATKHGVICISRCVVFGRRPPQPELLAGGKEDRIVNDLQNAKGESCFSVFRPRALKIDAVMSAAPQPASMVIPSPPNVD
jgi:hypothetical protein